MKIENNLVVHKKFYGIRYIIIKNSDLSMCGYVDRKSKYPADRYLSKKLKDELLESVGLIGEDYSLIESEEIYEVYEMNEKTFKSNAQRALIYKKK